MFGDDFGIPESGNGLPDLLDEIQVELEWLKRMQPSDLDSGMQTRELYGGRAFVSKRRGPTQAVNWLSARRSRSSTPTASLGTFWTARCASTTL